MINMSESFETIVNYTQGKLELIEQELKRSKNLQIQRSPFHIKVILIDLITTVECCKSLPIFTNINNIGKDEVLSDLCFIHDGFYRLADIYFIHIEQILCKYTSIRTIYELMNDIAFDILYYLQTEHEEYVKEWNKL